MHSLFRATRVAGLAVLVLAATAPLTMGAAAQVVPPPPMSGTGSGPSPASTAGPTPCPTDITGTICQAAGGPAGSTPTPTPSPTPSPTPGGGKPTTSPGGAPAGGAGPAQPGPPPPGPAGAAPAAAPTAGPAAIAQVAASFRNAPFLGQLLTILNHPLSAQRPDLRHFRPAGAAGGVDGSGGGPSGPHGAGLLGIGGPRSGSAPAVAVALLATLLAMLTALAMGSARVRLELHRVGAAVWRLHPSVHGVAIALHNLVADFRRGLRVAHRHLGVPHLARRHHSRRGIALGACTAALPALLAGAVLGSAYAGRDAGAPAAAASPASAYLRGEVSLENAIVPVAQPVSPPTWTRLVTIERGLLGQQDELTAQEAAITRLAVNVAGQQPDDDGPVPVGPATPPQLRNQLALLVAAHSATQAVYQNSLQAEYDLYRAAAQDPAQGAQLTAAAAAAQQPQAKEAVTYNLSLVQTQLAQEAQIAQAEGQLQQIGSLGQTQLEAMRHHQPFIAPEIAPVTQPFGPTDFSLEPPLAWAGTFYPHFHTGLDLGAPLDTPLHAAADGVVLLAAASVDKDGKLVGYGNYVVIAHPDGFVTLYGHLDTIAVKAGQVVHQGEIIGQEGSTGWSTGPHVHFEIRHDGQFLDPAPFLAGQLPAS
ncbi:MAG TPA: M23 family metallopeptidase [Candidatus Angelobacter sp.]|jgi:murein DD-endopeptidase MepM/ murein hydrolase activator NlpD|nr:M23 family metallopeptidase [Candidatus Angelobacter sp.]